ncbi:hypothetical protein M2140_002080 [Clostridiales Family XIII bacterium PM5-7]
MNLLIEKQNFSQLNINEWRGKCNDALDKLWQASWLTSSMNKTDQTLGEVITKLGDEIASKCNLVVIVATGHLGRTIKSVIDASPQTPQAPEVLVFGESLSTDHYAQLITRLETEDFVLIGETEGEESLQFKAAFTVLKQLLIDKYGTVLAADRIYAVAGKTSTLLGKDATENDYPLINYPEELDGLFAANTAAVLLPMAIKGVDLAAYLEGFYEMLSSPTWDLDGADYAMGRAAFLSEAMGKDHLWIWQNQFSGLGKWEEAFGLRALTLPDDEEIIQGKSFDTMITVKENWADIMTPTFDGCHEDGSLGLLLVDTWEACFSVNPEENPRVHLSVERLDSHTLGELMAFLQLSNGITEILLGK